MPPSKFVVVEKGYKRSNIFWVAESEDSKKNAEMEQRQDLDVAYAQDNENGCAFLLETFIGILGRIYRFLYRFKWIKQIKIVLRFNLFAKTRFSTRTVL